MKNRYFFSIIIPTFNTEKTIQKCIKSILNQSFEDYEVLIIDGKSTDRTLSMISVFNDSKIKTISELDQGIYDAMNKGISLANGKYLYFLGGDDTLFNVDVLKNIHTNINDNEDKVIYANVKMNGTNQWVKDGSIYGGTFDLKRILSHNIPHQAIFYHQCVFQKLGGYSLNYPVFADHDFNIKAFSTFAFKYLELTVANFYVGGASTGKTDGFRDDRVSNIVDYYRTYLNNKTFIPLRYYIREAAFNRNVKVGFGNKIYYSLLYFKLKIQSLLSWFH